MTMAFTAKPKKMTESAIFFLLNFMVGTLSDWNWCVNLSAFDKSDGGETRP